MGLDMYAYVGRPNQQEQYWENYDGNENTSVVEKPREIAYWRKHPNLHGWMERLWVEKGRPGVSPNMKDVMFNGVELELTWEDLEQLEKDITNGRLPLTSGFFFGDNSDDYYRNEDLEFIKKARAELFLGLQVFYNSSW